MNDQPSNVLTQIFAWVTAVASAAGIATQDLVYILFGFVGALVSVISLVSGRVDSYRNRKEDERRTQLFADYLKEVSKTPDTASPASVSEVMKKIGD